MIAFLKGKLALASPTAVVVDVNGVGYRLFIPASTFYHLPPTGSEVMFHTYLVIREEAALLYGFLDPDELTTFETLINVGGIGPKGALSILAAIDPAELTKAIINEDVTRLVKVPGIGKKTAQRIILELKDKITKVTGPVAVNEAVSGGQSSNETDAFDALIALGYQAAEARQALKKVLVNHAGSSTAEIIRLSLAQLASGLERR